MKVDIHATMYAPKEKNGEVIGQTGIREVILEDVANFLLNDNKIVVFYNDGKVEDIPLRGNDGTDDLDWRGVNIFVTRKFVTFDPTK